MIKTRKDGEVVVDAAKEITPDSRVIVYYDSTRAGEVKTMEGTPIEVHARVGGCRVVFRRDDGQKVIAKSTGGLYSEGSHHPYNGDIVEMGVINE